MSAVTVSIQRMKSRGDSAEPWWTPTLILNGPDVPTMHLTRLVIFVYMSCTQWTYASGMWCALIDCHIRSCGIRSKAFSRSRNDMWIFFSRCRSIRSLIACIASVVPQFLTKPHWFRVKGRLYFVRFPTRHGNVVRFVRRCYLPCRMTKCDERKIVMP